MARGRFLLFAAFAAGFLCTLERRRLVLAIATISSLRRTRIILSPDHTFRHACRRSAVTISQRDGRASSVPVDLHRPLLRFRGFFSCKRRSYLAPTVVAAPHVGQA